MALIGVYVVASYRLMPSMNRMLVALMSIKGYNYTFSILKGMPRGKDRIPARQDVTSGSYPFKKGITFQNISFEYPDSKEYALNNINLRIIFYKSSELHLKK